MIPEPEFSRLCRLLDESLRPYTDLSVSLTKQNERHLLIALSQVYRQIKLWTDEFDDSDSDTERIAKPYVKSEYSVSSTSHSEDHHCLAKIVGELVLLLAVDSRYVQHIVGNVLVVISEFVAASGSCWDEYMHLLCLCLELSICNCLPSLESPTRSKDLNCDSSTSVEVLKLALKTTTWSNVAGIICVLRNILKHLKKERDDQLLKVYLASIRTCLSNIPWDLLNEIHLGGKSWGISARDASLYTSIEQLSSRFLLSGNLVQFFCSLVAQGDSSETAVGYLNEQCVTSEISNILPKVLAWCLGKQEECNNTHTSQYLRHKILMLMIRLSYQIHLEHLVLVSWLNIIHKYFQDLLSTPLTKLAADQDDCLEGSPFLASFHLGKTGISSRHLQRLAVFLFLRCSLSLISQRDRKEQCVCANMNTCLVFDQNWGPACCSRNQGFLELSKWLQRHLPYDIFLDNDIYFERCTSFALSFLQLYIHEVAYPQMNFLASYLKVSRSLALSLMDDILFKVLLQLFCTPFSERPVCEGENTFQEVKHDLLSLVSNLLNPIRLFHLFLAELHYDHQVLLDYLISRDTGASSAEYLLRCLRTVCDSWDFFAEFSLGEEIINQAHRKKRKILVDGLDFQESLFSAQHEGAVAPLSLQKGSKREHKCGSKQHGIKRLPFEDAMECLLSLKNSLVNLHKKKLFPYNPDVLLRRLKRFEELCLKQKNMLESEVIA